MARFAYFGWISCCIIHERGDDFPGFYRSAGDDNHFPTPSPVTVSHTIDDALVRWGSFCRQPVPIVDVGSPALLHREVRRINYEGQPLGTNCKGWDSRSKTVQVALQRILISAWHLCATLGLWNILDIVSRLKILPLGKVGVPKCLPA